VTWWRDAVVYQIYPRSFRDANGDGVGDLDGIRQQLAYLAWLGVDALWLSPFYPSPMHDFGYDVSDYVGVDPLFGTLEDFDNLVHEAHELHLRVIVDWVPNHTSNEHPWFVESRSSRDSARRDWYVWRDAKADGGVPNNWVRAWSDESVWTWDAATAQYYLHCFLESQPDLNWANGAVRDAMHDTLRFWLERGVDGFRMDVVHLLGKDVERDDPEELRALSHVPLNNVALTHDYLREVRRLIDGYDANRVSIGEVFLLDPERVADYYGDHDELHLSFNFAPLFIGWRAASWEDVIVRTEQAFEGRGAWPTWVMSNHDTRRMATRLGGDEERIRAAILLLLSLRGTAFLYAGEELGLEDAVVSPASMIDPGGRDGCRAPMPWTSEPGHGWVHEPWLPFEERAGEKSVDNQMLSDESVLHFSRQMLGLRRSSNALRRGAIRAVHCVGDVLVFDRVAEEQHLRVMVNFSSSDVEVGDESPLVVSSSRHHRPGLLGPGEALVLEVAHADNESRRGRSGL